MKFIQEEWFSLLSQNDINFRLIEGFLNSIKENFSNFLLERIVNLQDANVRINFKINEFNILFFVIREIQLFIIVLLMVIGLLLICY